MIGTLTQAYTMLEWNGETLHAYDIGLDDGTKENIAQNVSVKLDKSSAAPSATFQITPNPAGFKLFQKLKSSALDQPISISFGYIGGTVTRPFQFIFAGVSLTTGFDPKLEITCVSPVKGAWTDNKISFTMEKELPLSDYPELLKTKCGEGCKELNFQFVGTAKEKAAKIKVKGNQMQRTPHNILTDVLRPHGMDLQVSDNALEGTMIISYSPAKEGELQKDKPVVSKRQPCGPGERCVYVIGPGLMTNITRNQTFNVGSDSTKNAASATSPIVSQTAAVSVSQPQTAAPQTITVESTNKAGGTSGQANPGSGNTGSTAAGKDGQEAALALAKMITTTVNFSVMMVPYMVGIKPRDLIAIPSLKGPGDYIEDWEVKTVSYEQDTTGGVTIAITGERPYTGEEQLLDEATVSQVKSTVAGLVTPDAWAQFYWRPQG